MATGSGMRYPLVAATAASILALSAGFAAAQSSGSGIAPGGAGAPPLSAQPAARPQPPTPNPLTLEDTAQIKGTAVYGSDDKKIGSISTVLMKPESKTIDRLVVGEGGVLGVGAHRVALPIDAFTWDGTTRAFKIAKTAEDLKAMPEWNEQVGAMPEPAPTATPPMPPARNDAPIIDRPAPVPGGPGPSVPPADAGRT